MRDGCWKLVRGAIPRRGSHDPADGELDRRIKLERDPALLLEPDAPQVEPDLGEPTPTMLFNISEDVGEQHDLAAREPARVARMEAMLDQWYDEVEAERARKSK